MSRGITIVGLGPGSPGLLTVEANEILASSNEIYLRTRRHPTVDALETLRRAPSFDDVYERAASFADIYVQIAATVVDLGAREQGVVFAVPGHPRVGEATVGHIVTMAEKAGVPVRIVDGLSFIEPLCTLMGLDVLGGVQIADAMTLAERHYPEFNPDLPLLVAQLYSRELAADVKLVLMMAYPDEHQVAVVRAAGGETPGVWKMPLYELDRLRQLDHLTTLLVPGLDKPGSLEAFQELVAHLRAADGCPWDREQTHRSLRSSLLEETYEVLEALDAGDVTSLSEELGDLLLQVMLHTQIATELGEFKMSDVVSQVVDKLRRRHPHVFGQVQVSGAEDVLVNWERIKGEEKKQSTGKASNLSVPQSLPALARAQAVQQRAARMGLERSDDSASWCLVEAHMRDLRKASDEASRDGILGDLLLAVSNLARAVGIDAESALRRAVSRFEAQLFDRQEPDATTAP